MAIHREERSTLILVHDDSSSLPQQSATKFRKVFMPHRYMVCRSCRIIRMRQSPLDIVPVCEGRTALAAAAAAASVVSRAIRNNITTMYARLLLYCPCSPHSSYREQELQRNRQKSTVHTFSILLKVTFVFYCSFYFLSPTTAYYTNHRTTTTQTMKSRVHKFSQRQSHPLLSWKKRE